MNCELSRELQRDRPTGDLPPPAFLGLVVQTNPIGRADRARQSQFALGGGQPPDAQPPLRSRAASAKSRVGQTKPIRTGAMRGASRLWARSYGVLHMHKTSAKQSQSGRSLKCQVTGLKLENLGPSARSSPILNFPLQTFATPPARLLVQTNPIRTRAR